MLGKKTRVLATHAIDFMHLADRVIVLKAGKVEVQGAYNDISENPVVKEILSMHKKNESEKKEAFDSAPEATVSVPDQDESSNSSAAETLEMTKKSSKSLDELSEDRVKHKMDKYLGK